MKNDYYDNKESGILDSTPLLQQELNVWYKNKTTVKTHHLVLYFFLLGKLGLSEMIYINRKLIGILIK